MFFPNNQYVGRITIFEEMMEYLYKNGYKTISTKEFYKWYYGYIDYYGKTLMITFDDGKYEDYYLVYPILKKYNFKAVSFLVGSKIEKKTKEYNKMKENFIGLDVINKIRKEYPFFELQSHSYNMHRKFNNTGKIFLMSNNDLDEDFCLNKIFNFSIFAYPYGFYNKNIQYFLNKYNYLFAFTFGKSEYASRKNERFSIPRIKINGYANLNTLKKWLNI